VAAERPGNEWTREAPEVMPSYRFCRPDDIPFLVRAVNACFDVHFPDRPPLTVDGFRREMKHLDLWPSSCLIAAEGDDPVAVLTGTKRDDETLVSRIGVRPGLERDGHGGHLLTSLGQKLAVLGPPRLAVEVPASRPGALAFFRALGWRDDGVYVDLEGDLEQGGPEGGGTDGRGETRKTPVEPPPEGLVGTVTVAELDAAGVLAPGAGTAPASAAGGASSGAEADTGTGAAVEPDAATGTAVAAVPPGLAPTAWERRPASLRGRADALRGAAIASPDRIESWILWEPAPGSEGTLEVAAWGFGDAGSSPPGSQGAESTDRRALLLSLLLRHLLTAEPTRRLRLVKTSAGEVPSEIVAALGLQPAERYHRLITDAQPL